MILYKTSRDNMHEVEKKWGYELWIENNKDFCGKLLHIKACKGTSMHFHVLKHETMYVKSGCLIVDYIDTDDGQEHYIELFAGESVYIKQGLPHRLRASSKGDCNVFEFSTQHFDSDSYRVGPRCV